MPLNIRWVARIILAPISLIYGLVIGLRNVFYDTGILKSSSFQIPVIGVGNLSMGGSGKTPHVEYLIHHLSPYIPLGILSRGYMRKTRGYLEVEPTHKVEMCGDESLQYKLKYPQAVVSVCEQRAIGIPMMVGDHPDLGLIVLDDAFQHRSVRPALNVLVTDFKLPFTQDYLLPGGRLREWRSSSKRADVIIVSKCPANMSLDERNQLKKDINPLPHQKVYFSYYQYGTPYYMYDASKKITLDAETDVVMLTGIAKPEYLEDYLHEKVHFVNPHTYEDHHVFNPHEVSQVNRALQELHSPKKIVLTTEKDSTRLDAHRDFLMNENIPIYIIPIHVVFFEDSDNEPFVDYIKSFLLNYKS